MESGCDRAFLGVRRKLGTSPNMTGRSEGLCLEGDTQKQGSVVNIRFEETWSCHCQAVCP